ncbi:PREDICTED: T-cell differentiation antigen CD6 [Condylura cristata]|uniref:T-cell differentiation antigen CD6 n=1 Tax=Condylura cristata TaxID=143302 RepID=UPI000643A4EC|nr:PREDICTED: T-cell differentiation antigen CD6 [Condylura cristata]
MAPAAWLFLATAGLLTEALSGHPSPAPPGQANSSPADRRPAEPGQHLGVRLVNGSSRCSGMVELWRGSSWVPACGDFWSHSATEAVCRALDCGGAGAPMQPALPAPEVPPDRPFSPPENQALRLVSSSSPCAGRVEMLEHGEWGSVCDDTWDLEAAQVVCRQLGCGWAVQALPGMHFPPGQGPIHRDQVNCSGAEAHLWDCPGVPGQGYCGHKEDAGVVCSEHQSWRLTGGTDPCQGQVEVYFRGVWNTVCDSSWYSPEANVLCRALGCGNMIKLPKGGPHSLPGRMFYSCMGGEPALSDCSWRFNNSNLCSQSQAARVLCSGSWTWLNLSTSEGPTRVPAVTVESVTVKADLDSQGDKLLIPCIILGVLLLGALLSIAIILLRVKGKYALPVTVNHQHLPTPTPAVVNSYQEVPNIIPKEEDPKLPIQVQAPHPADSDSDSDYEHYDFSSQPPVALTTFYNSQRHRPTDEEVQQSRFHLPALEEGESGWGGRPPPANPALCIADTLSLGPRHQPRNSSGSSTSSGEGYCNNPSTKVPPWDPPVFSSQKSLLLEQPLNLELAGSQATFSAGPSADDSSSTSSGEWYQNYQPPPQPPSEEEPFGCPGSPSPQPESTDEDYDDIGAA